MNGAPSSFDIVRVGGRTWLRGFSFYSRLYCSVVLRQATTLCVPVSPSRNIVCCASELSAADPNSLTPLTVWLPLSSCGSPLGTFDAAVDHSGLYDALNLSAKLEDPKHQKAHCGQQPPLVISSLYSFWLGVCTWLQSLHLTVNVFPCSEDRGQTAPVYFFQSFHGTFFCYLIELSIQL